METSVLWERGLKTALVLLFVSSATAQEHKANRIQPSCGPGEIQFEVRTSKGRTDSDIEAGKARVYIVEVFAKYPFEFHRPILRIGLNGTWVGATRGNSYFDFSVGPGEHHLCVQWQSRSLWREAAFASFTAETGKKYYFRARITHHVGLDLEKVDRDEGQFLVSSSVLSISRLKK
jgi:hypothetical protein